MIQNEFLPEAVAVCCFCVLSVFGVVLGIVEIYLSFIY